MDVSTATQILRNDPAAREQAEQRFAEVLSRAATDVIFRQQLIAEPRAALSSHYGRELPESLNVVFIENQAAATVVLPDFIDVDAPLSEEELETVAGGTSSIDPSTAAAALIIGGCIYVLTHL
jgi:hypothetical protein